MLLVGPRIMPIGKYAFIIAMQKNVNLKKILLEKLSSDHCTLNYESLKIKAYSQLILSESKTTVIGMETRHNFNFDDRNLTPIVNAKTCLSALDFNWILDFPNVSFTTHSSDLLVKRVNNPPKGGHDTTTNLLISLSTSPSSCVIIRKQLISSDWPVLPP